jgi:farnesyl diphosphate synthase
MILADALARNAAEIEQALEAILAPERLAPAPVRLVAAMRHGALAGGKRLRPFLVRQTAALFGVPPRQSLGPALAVELVHCYSLIHDDLPAMDDDDFRRGRPTVHRAFDEATAILAGDALLTLAFGVLADGGNPLLVHELATAAGATGMVGGQARDLAAESGTPIEAEIGQLQAMKTGALICAAVRMGAIIGGADAAALASLSAYAERAGRVFQVADDLLDATSSAEALGKAAGKDAGRNKATLVARLGIPAARRRLGDLVHDAITALTPFGPKADTLRETARYFATREN